MKYPLLMGMLFPVVALAVALPLSVLILPTPTVTGQTTAGQIAAPPSPASAATASPPSTSVTTPSVPRTQTDSAVPATRPVPTTSAATTRPASAEFTPVQYAEQVRGVIDRITNGPYTTDSSYAIGSVPQDTPALADGENVDLVRATCSVCHATTFITSQPPLPAATWHDEVYKMKEKYGATFISDENADKIIAYLSAHYTPETRRAETPDAVRPAGQP
ncbi:cytochrome c [Deinococcus sp. DB0503]|uniref:c-type cytochrome n=1 Tax=Deinococcus sp. DB0503 TaxID=2479203 RepID=UPI0018DF37D3|nr:cytochrome c [Deinococcus sp. DB0503]MBI0446377.1 cytochrome c [Deinococcus sp. DB0503]